MDAALALFTRQLGTLLGSGLNLRDSLDLCERDRMRPVVAALRVDLERGLSLRAAMGRQPAVFSPVYRALVGAGEAGGTLDWALALLARLLERELGWKRQVRTALLYPALVFLVAIGVALFMLLWILPNFVQLFEGMNLQLPLSTRLMDGATKTARQPWFLPALMLGMALALRLLRRVPPEWLPVVAGIHRLAALGRLCRTFGTLLAGGVDLLPALDMAGEASGNRAMRAALRRVRQQVDAGGDLAASLADSLAFPVLLPPMVAVGLESGTLDAMLLRLADLFEVERQHRMASLLRRVEPMMMGVLAWVLLALARSLLDRVYGCGCCFSLG